MSSTLVFCFDYASPYSYLAQTQLPALLERTGASLEYRPVLLGGIFKATGNRAPLMDPCENKRNYSSRALMEWVAHYRQPFQMNPNFPVNTIKVMRTSVAAQREGVFEAFHSAIFAAMWIDGRNLGEDDEIAAVASEAGLDGRHLVSCSQEQGIKNKLRENTEETVARGAFGVPTFLVGDKLFWGADHMHFAEKALLE